MLKLFFIVVVLKQFSHAVLLAVRRDHGPPRLNQRRDRVCSVRQHVQAVPYHVQIAVSSAAAAKARNDTRDEHQHDQRLMTINREALRTFTRDLPAKCFETLNEIRD